MDNFNDSLVKERVAIATENSRKKLRKSIYKVEYAVFITNWINRLNPKKPYSKREKPTKGSKHQREERFGIKANITIVKHQVCYAEVKEIVNEMEDIEVDQEIRVSYDCIIKIN